MRRGCDSNAGKWQLARLFCSSHVEWDGEWLSLSKGTSTGLWHNMDGNPGMSWETFLRQGQAQGNPEVHLPGHVTGGGLCDSVVGTMMKDLEVLYWYHQTRCFALLFLHLPTIAASKGTPRARAAAQIACTNADCHCLPQISFSFPAPTLAILSLCYFWPNFFLQVFEPKLTRLQFFQMNVAFVCMTLSLLV